jgi:hypothetical protein
MRKLMVLALALALTLPLAPTASASSCTQQLVDAMEACSNLGTWIERSACGIDAEIDYVACVRGVILG